MLVPPYLPRQATAFCQHSCDQPVAQGLFSEVLLPLHFRAVVMEELLELHTKQERRVFGLGLISTHGQWASCLGAGLLAPLTSNSPWHFLVPLCPTCMLVAT